MPHSAAQPSYSAAEFELADRARAGDQQALVELYQRYRRPLLRHAWRMLHSESAAQDVVQEAFTRAIEAMPRTRAELKFKAWIFRIATNLCLRQLNRRGRLVFDGEADGADGRRQPVASPQTDPEQARRRAEIAAHVARALEQLPARYRQLRLDDLPRIDEPLTRTRATLLQGSLRARATTPGRGLEIAALHSRCRWESGELRLRRAGAQLLLESLDAVVTVSGAYAARRMTPASRLAIGARPGFAHGLLPAAVQLRPISARGSSPPRLTWEAVPSARSYRVLIARDTDFMQVLQTHDVQTRDVRPARLAAGKYYWQVIASDGRHLGHPSKI